jgi:hypothetical protein
VKLYHNSIHPVIAGTLFPGFTLPKMGKIASNQGDVTFPKGFNAIGYKTGP